MRIRIFFILMAIAVLLASLSYAEEAIFLAESLKADLHISSSMDIVPLEPDYRLEKVTADLSFFPREDSRQRIESMRTEPGAYDNETDMVFEWSSPAGDELGFWLDSTLSMSYGFVNVGRKIAFPLRNIPEDVARYTRPTDNINSDDRDIIEVASQLASGEDDAYAVVFRIGDWVKSNINYSLDTLTASISQSASWVLKSRYGVCDELTSLFIAMVRSVGVPAKYVSGLAYTNWNSINDFGAHAWAEVYLPDIGWVGFDITYGQLGFVDATHIKLKESADSDETSTRYRWEGFFVDINTEPLDMAVEVKSTGSQAPPILGIRSNIIKEKAAFGSYNLLEVELRNYNTYYVPTEVYLSRSEGVQILGNMRRNVLVEPGERKKLYWILKVDDNLDRDYIYTFTMGAYTTRNASSESQFKASSNEPLYSLEEIRKLMEQQQEEETKVYSASIEFSCSADKENYAVGEKGTATCSIRNTGNKFLEGVNVCLENCEAANIGISQTEVITLPLDTSTIGKKDPSIVVRNRDVSKSYSVQYNVLDQPRLEITSLNHPQNVSFDSTYSISFVLKKLSSAPPLDVKVRLEQEGIEKTWQINRLEEDRRFILNLAGSDLNYGENDFTVTVDYKDIKNNHYQEKAGFRISMTDASALQRSFLFLNRVGRGLSNFDLKALIIVAFVFGLSIGFIFRRKRRKRRKKKEKEE